MSEPTLRECVRQELLEAYDLEESDIFETLDSETVQSSKHKLEGYYEEG